MNDTNPPRTRRITISDLKRDRKALLKAIRKETRRRDAIIKLRQENSELQVQLSRLRSYDEPGY